MPMGRYCARCSKVHAHGEQCPHRKRQRTSGDGTRAGREPWRSKYSDAEYRRNRQAVIARQNGRCKDCGAKCAHQKEDGTWITALWGGEVDHEDMLREGGTHSTETMALRCKSCHAKADAARRRARREGLPFPENLPR